MLPLVRDLSLIYVRTNVGHSTRQTTQERNLSFHSLNVQRPAAAVITFILQTRDQSDFSAVSGKTVSTPVVEVNPVNRDELFRRVLVTGPPPGR